MIKTMPDNFDKPKPEEIPGFLAERGVDPNATTQSVDDQRSLWSDSDRPHPTHEGGDPDMREDQRAQAAALREIEEQERAATDAAARAHLRESTTIKSAPPHTGAAELPHFSQAPKSSPK